jgi:hypothetical protein
MLLDEWLADLTAALTAARLYADECMYHLLLLIIMQFSVVANLTSAHQLKAKCACTIRCCLLLCSSVEFHLRLREFLQLVQRGSTTEALQHAQQHIAPNAADHPAEVSWNLLEYHF